MSSVNVKFFGPARDLAGAEQVQVEVADGETVGSLAGKLAQRFERLGRMPGIRLAVNRAYVALDHKLSAGDDVAVIPPVSGG